MPKSKFGRKDLSTRINRSPASLIVDDRLGTMIKAAVKDRKRCWSIDGAHLHHFPVFKYRMVIHPLAHGNWRRKSTESSRSRCWFSFGQIVIHCREHRVHRRAIGCAGSFWRDCVSFNTNVTRSSFRLSQRVSFSTI